MICKRWIKLVILLFPIQLFSQENNAIPSFYEIIQGDSVMMFFNAHNHFTSKSCASYTRYVRINSNNGNFNGYFEDVTSENLLLGKGSYVDGLKHGCFETYYPNGKIKVKGCYQQNIPDQQWDYFYENGLPERTLKFTGTDTLLVNFVDEKGNIAVSNGNGYFYGSVAGSSKSDGLLAKGKVINGKPHGKWTSTYFGNTYCKEEFNNGKLIRGVFPNARIGRTHTSKSHLNTFLLDNYYEFLEN
jgi:antitoxin component YwqK of YwqJK toxin-antitoxin module